MKKHISIIAVGCALCIAAVGAFTGCSESNSSEPVETVATDTVSADKTEQAEASTQTEGEVMAQSIPITSDNAKLQSRTVVQDGVLWLVQSGSAAEFTVSGKTASLTIAGSSGVNNDEEHRPRCAVYIDDKLIFDEIIGDKDVTVSLWKDADKTASVKVMLLSEAMFGGVGIRSVNVDSDSAQPVMPAEKATLTIEFIGDSITCGYGVESKSSSEPFMTSTENFTKSYAYLTAKELGADYMTCCYSGYGVVSGYTGDGMKNADALLPDCYELSSSFEDYGTDWTFPEQCDVVVINLGTNDFNYVSQDLEVRGSEFADSYKAFLKTVREKRPDAVIICTVGTMGGDDIYKLIERAVAEFGDDKITAYFSQPQSMHDGMGANGHPSKKTQQNSADVLAEKIRSIVSI
ncbi:SGNH/GDSL hydrolase family protein [Ruminococcus flavefaciens]|uniref:SGNH/GDSL hydrolase family protein n=1 Tax=Ruminococcus flavefaciens TaxID=1265 RepID=UPI0012BCD582|nr:SGNH/GDSL hydrolase family protein [Ruminococcus flavefaciens]